MSFSIRGLKIKDAIDDQTIMYNYNCHVQRNMYINQNDTS